ncbi:hypothetical protein BX281_7662 [Streptomyces sp. Ag82_O1-15]|nr:hypothetical protein BX281_7662 [Streptomyces sp. Ag82_O1-15]
MVGASSRRATPASSYEVIRGRTRSASSYGVKLTPRTRPTCERSLLLSSGFCFNGGMASFQKYTATGRPDLEPFWPSRQHHDFDRVCCRATNAPAL